MKRKYFWIESSWCGGKWYYYKSYSSLKACKNAISDIYGFANDCHRFTREDLEKLTFRIVKSPYPHYYGDYSETYKYEIITVAG